MCAHEPKVQKIKEGFGEVNMIQNAQTWAKLIFIWYEMNDDTRFTTKQWDHTQAHTYECINIWRAIDR